MQVSNRAVEQHKRKSVFVQLVDGRLVYTVTGGFEVSARDNLERVANVHD